MTSVSTTIQPRNYLPLTIAMMTCVILLINVSFKIIVVQDIVFTASSVLGPVIAGLYLLVLEDCDLTQQRQVLNQSLLALYLFSIGIYLLVNLPAAADLRDNVAYQIVYEDVPRKFFAATLAFGLSFYLPHLYCCAKKKEVLSSPKYRLLLVLLGGFLFFSLDYFLLFFEQQTLAFLRIYIDSLLVSLGILLLIGVLYLVYLLSNKTHRKKEPRQVDTYFLSPTYHYLVGFAISILMICLACEYRLISLVNGWILPASGLLIPLIFIVSNLIGELYGYKANLRLTAILLLAELTFDVLLMIVVNLPSPDFFNLNPFYSFILPRRIPAASLTLLCAFGGNALLLEKLKNTVYGQNRALRIFIANILANSLLCIVNHTILFAGVFPYEQVFNLAFNSWSYKFLATAICLPIVLYIYNGLISRPKESF